MLFKTWHIIAIVVIAALIYLYSTSPAPSAEGYHNYYYPRDWWWGNWRWPLTNLRFPYYDDLTYSSGGLTYYFTYPYRYFMRRPTRPMRPIRRYW